MKLSRNPKETLEKPSRNPEWNRNETLKVTLNETQAETLKKP